MKTKIMPVDDRVIAKRVEADTMTKGGIVIPDNAKQKPQRAIIVAVGSGKPLDDGGDLPMPFSVGDEIYFDRYAANEIKVDDEDLIILERKSILAHIVSQ